MGGAYQAKGNSSFGAEFNIHQDPEAASICFESFYLTMVPWEVCVDYALGNDFYVNIIEKQQENNPMKTFLVNILKNYRSSMLLACV